MKIDEPKTPYQQPQSHRSPEALQLDGSGSGSEPLSPSSTNGSGAGAPPSDLNLGDRIMDISNQALKRREHEWSEDDDEEDDADSGSRSKPSSAAAAAAASSGSHAHSRHAPSAIETGMSSDGGASSGADTPEHKHAVFEAKKKANYSHMVRGASNHTHANTSFELRVPRACLQLPEFLVCMLGSDCAPSCALSVAVRCAGRSAQAWSQQGSCRRATRCSKQKTARGGLRNTGAITDRQQAYSPLD